MVAYSHLLVLVAVVFGAIGAYGIFYFGNQVAAKKDENLNQKLSSLTTTEQTLRLAAIHKIGLAGGIIKNRDRGDGVRAEFYSMSRPFSTICEYLADIPDLREISLSGSGYIGPRPKIDSLSQLSHLVGLEGIDLRDAGIEDLTPLTNLVNLRFLYLSNNLIKDITPLGSLRNLVLLDIAENPIKYLAPIKSNHALQVLWAHGTEVTDLQPLMTLPALKSLDLEGFLSQKRIPIDPSEVKRFREARPDVKVQYDPEG